MGYDRPPFYITVTNAAIPDTLHRIVIAEQRATARMLAYRFGNWPARTGIISVGYRRWPWLPRERIPAW